MLLAGLAAVVALAAVLTTWGWLDNAERRAIQRVPPPDRVALFTDAKATMDSLCARAAIDPALRGRCAASAELLLAFPECDPACRAEAVAFTPQPMR